ncbi:hypothetical protein RH915_02790 [Serpentinicella sp. ANB-PHB4]|uniref:hypothetical protein n=1 Tax=Serpentinicella sp. ANB-PHB4 TaxID=3074076 RepID=UPI002861F5C4|nr:hypothetical protein [Serpentinicella sp. ANB-PHB4]MDR5658408.1 hypothetical protein [Serpentinicella sp. ANB-PHB4]
MIENSMMYVLFITIMLIQFLTGVTLKKDLKKMFLQIEAQKNVIKELKNAYQTKTDKKNLENLIRQKVQHNQYEADKINRTTKQRIAREEDEKSLKRKNNEVRSVDKIPHLKESETFLFANEIKLDKKKKLIEMDFQVDVKNK